MFHAVLVADLDVYVRVRQHSRCSERAGPRLPGTRTVISLRYKPSQCPALAIRQPQLIGPSQFSLSHNSFSTPQTPSRTRNVYHRNITCSATPLACREHRIQQSLLRRPGRQVRLDPRRARVDRVYCVCRERVCYSRQRADGCTRLRLWYRYV